MIKKFTFRLLVILILPLVLNKEMFSNVFYKILGASFTEAARGSTVTLVANKKHALSFTVTASIPLDEQIQDTDLKVRPWHLGNLALIRRASSAGFQLKVCGCAGNRVRYRCFLPAQALGLNVANQAVNKTQGSKLLGNRNLRWVH